MFFSVWADIYDNLWVIMKTASTPDPPIMCVPPPLIYAPNPISIIIIFAALYLSSGTLKKWEIIILLPCFVCKFHGLNNDDAQWENSENLDDLNKKKIFFRGIFWDPTRSGRLEVESDLDIDPYSPLPTTS